MGDAARLPPVRHRPKLTGQQQAARTLYISSCSRMLTDAWRGSEGKVKTAVEAAARRALLRKQTWRLRGFRLDTAPEMAAARPPPCDDEGPGRGRGGTFVGRAGADSSIDGRTDSSSTQYGTACKAVLRAACSHDEGCKGRDTCSCVGANQHWVAFGACHTQV